MSFLAGRLAATEGAFFSQHSKQAAIALKQKLKASNPAPSSSPNPIVANASQADILPEVLRHSLPIGPKSTTEMQVESVLAATSLAASLRLTMSPRRSENDGVCEQGLRLLRLWSTSQMFPRPLLVGKSESVISNSQWNIEAPEVKMVASTANEARVVPGNNTNEKAAMEGLYVVTKAFAVATGLVFGGTIIAAAVTTSRLGIQSSDDIRTRGQQYLQPQVEQMKQRFEPLKSWAQRKATVWRMEESQRRALGADYAKSLGIKQPEFRK